MEKTQHTGMTIRLKYFLGQRARPFLRCFSVRSLPAAGGDWSELRPSWTYLGTAGQSDQEVEHEQTGDESLTIVLDDRILITERGDDRFGTSELYNQPPIQLRHIDSTH